MGLLTIKGEGYELDLFINIFGTFMTWAKSQQQTARRFNIRIKSAQGKRHIRRSEVKGSP
jgi:hypothetical protein